MVKQAHLTEDRKEGQPGETEAACGPASEQAQLCPLETRESSWEAMLRFSVGDAREPAGRWGNKGKGNLDTKNLATREGQESTRGWRCHLKHGAQEERMVWPVIAPGTSSTGTFWTPRVDSPYQVHSSILEWFGAGFYLAFPPFKVQGKHNGPEKKRWA